MDICLANKIAAVYIQSFKETCEKIYSSAPDVLFVIGAGNDNMDVHFTQSALANMNLPNVLTVGGVDCTGNLAYFSSIGNEVNIYANAWDSVVLPGNEKQIWWGTSFSAPQVTNLAVKLLAIDSNLTLNELRSLILDHADFDKEKNIRILNAEASMKALANKMKK